MNKKKEATSTSTYVPPPKAEWKEYADRPARKQGDVKRLKRTQTIEATGSYNIWYNKWSGYDNKDPKNLERAEARCSIERDSGITKAKEGKPIFCLHFAHGTCIKGPKCPFLHRLPTPQDYFPITQDVFGREKHRTERDDMMGVGSFEREGKVLYVGNITNSSDAERIVAKHFSEWGEIEHIRMLTGRGIAFVRFRHRCSAEFAKEAMFGQSLDHNEILLVKWANDDPNSMVNELRKRKAQEVVENTILSKLPKVGDKGTILDYQEGAEDSENKAVHATETENYPYYNQEGTQEHDLQKAWADYYAAGGTPEAAAAYYASQGITMDQSISNKAASDTYDQAQYGYSMESYEATERIASGADNSIYALPNAGKSAKNALDAILTESAPEPTVSKGGPLGLVAYDSD